MMIKEQIHQVHEMNPLKSKKCNSKLWMDIIQQQWCLKEDLVLKWSRVWSAPRKMKLLIICFFLDKKILAGCHELAGNKNGENYTIEVRANSFW